MKGQETTFYQDLQNCKTLDQRDNRGKRHKLAFILLGLTLGLLRKRDGQLSSIHRSMQNTNDTLCDFLSIENQGVISRSQLPVALKNVCLHSFETLLFNSYGIELSREEKDWFAGDGKELRGSIEKGDKRGDAIVQLVRHKDRNVLSQSFYNGKKESEKPCLRALIKDSGAAHQKITADALHLCPKTTELMAEAGGIFLIGLKDNQRKLLANVKGSMSLLKPVNQLITIEKGHGRVETRTYYQYDISGEYFDKRWHKTKFKSVFKVVRRCYNIATKKETTETSYYISNGKAIVGDHSFFYAIRKHWSVEVVNHIRDVTLREDNLTTKKKEVTKVLAGLRTLVIKLLGIKKPPNLIAQLEYFQDNFIKLLEWLSAVNFL